MTPVLLPVLAVIFGPFFLNGRPAKSRGYAMVGAIALICVFCTQSSGLYWQASCVAATLLLFIGDRIAVRGGRGESVSPRGKAVLIAVGLWYAYVFVTATWIAGTWSPIRAVVLIPTLIALAYFASRMTPPDVVQAFRGILWIGLAEAVYGIQLWRQGVRGLWVPADDVDRANPLPGMNEVARVSGTMQHPIPYSLFLVCCIVLLIANAGQWKIHWRVLWGLVIFGGIYVAGSRSSFIGLAVGVVVFAAQATTLGKFIRNALLVGFLGGLILVVLGDQIEAVSRALKESGSYAQRQSSIDSLSVLMDRTGAAKGFGTGYGNVAALYSQGWLHSPFKFYVIDNWFVYLLGTMGTVGFFLFTVFLCRLFMVTGRVGRSVLAVFIAYFFAFDIYIWVSMWYLTIVFAILSGITVKKKAKSSPARVPQNAVEARLAANGPFLEERTA